MAEDHYVAQTYLRNWCLVENKSPLQAYRKSDLKQFPCWPANVCREWDGDLNPTYFDNPAVLGDFRKIFEPKWKSTVEGVSAGNIDPEDKRVLSMAWAHFSLCPPAQRERAKTIYTKEARALALNIEIEREHDFFKRFATMRLTEATWIFYNQEWIILLNETETPFLTSDNPSAIVPESKPQERILPISPSLCLYAKIVKPFADTDHFDLGSPPKGSTFRRISRPRAMEINRFTIINANDLVFSQSVDVGIAALVKKYRDVRPRVEPTRAAPPADGGALIGATLTIGPRAK
ncbi:MAG: DUF4238 domain-containing protein [Methylocella sp.]